MIKEFLICGITEKRITFLKGVSSSNTCYNIGKWIGFNHNREGGLNETYHCCNTGSG